MKRGANVQLTQDYPSDEDKVSDTGAFKRASDDIISKRIIKPLKKKSSTGSMLSPAPAPVGTSFGSTTPVTGSTAFGAATPFSSNVGTAGSTFGTTLSAVGSRSGVDSSAPLMKAPVAQDKNDLKAKEIRGLNTSFLNYITKCVKEDCFVDLSKVNLEYNSYLSKIGQKSDTIDLGALPQSNQKLPLTVNFGSKPQEAKSKDMSAFRSSLEKTSDSPFSFQTPKVNDFAAKSTEAPKFDFSNTAKTTEAPKFDFSNTAKTTEAPKFEFALASKFDFASTAKASETPKFDFSSNTTPSFNFSTPKIEASKSPFGFPAANNQQPSIFSPAAVPSFGVNAPAAGLAGMAGGAATGNENADGEDEVFHEEQVGDALMSGKAGEEGEVTLYSVRSKLRKFVNGSWEVIGLGLLKVNQNQSTKASRIILRSEAGKVLLNVSIFDGMTVTLKDTSVNFSASLTAGSLTTVSAKVKEKTDAAALVDALEKAKSKG